MRALAEAPLLELVDCTVRFGGLTAVDGLSFVLPPGELLGIIGPNGAGKTTVFNAITGVYRPAGGVISFAGKPIHGLGPHRIARLGIGRTFQSPRLLRGMSVLDNMAVAAAVGTGARCTMVGAMGRTRSWRAQEARVLSRARELLEVFGLSDRAEDLAGSLPYGEQRRLEIVRALAMDPRLLLLDEPAAGLNQAERAALIELIGRLVAQHRLTIALIEHDMRFVTSICDRLLVLNYGRQIAAGTPQEVTRDPAVVEAYLGEPVA